MRILIFFFIALFHNAGSEVVVGVENLFSKDYGSILKGRSIGLVTNHTAINSKGELSSDLFKKNSSIYQYSIKAFFSPEHGLYGLQSSEQLTDDSVDKDGIPIYSLHGKTRRPTSEMLEGINLLIFDMQDIGSRSYTYCTTLFYLMEEAALAKIPVVVLDRPNPLGGLLVDGPMLEDRWRSFVGYLNVPYCHGLTVGELAQYFNGEYKIGCQLRVIPMKGWKRHMTFEETGLMWVPTSPNIPEANTVFFYPSTGQLGELQIVNIGIGYTLPFKVVGAPWIDALNFSSHLNAQKLPGVYFHPFHYQPVFGRFAGKDCHGILIMITDIHKYLPVTTQYLIIGMLKSLYPEEFQAALKASSHREEMFNKVNGTDQIYRIINEERYPFWTLRKFHSKERINYLTRRRPYLISNYSI